MIDIRDHGGPFGGGKKDKGIFDLYNLSHYKTSDVQVSSNDQVIYSEKYGVFLFFSISYNILTVKVRSKTFALISTLTYSYNTNNDDKFVVGTFLENDGNIYALFAQGYYGVSNYLMHLTISKNASGNYVLTFVKRVHIGDDTYHLSKVSFTPRKDKILCCGGWDRYNNKLVNISNFSVLQSSSPNYQGDRDSGIYFLYDDVNDIIYRKGPTGGTSTKSPFGTAQLINSYNVVGVD